MQIGNNTEIILYLVINAHSKYFIILFLPEFSVHI